MRVFEFNKVFKKVGQEFKFIDQHISKRILSILIEGAGYLLIKEFPFAGSSITSWENEVLRFSFSLGVPVSQNVSNEFVCRVQDVKARIENKERGYQSSQPLPFHSDRCDLLVLVGINPANFNGETLIVDSKKIHEQITAEFPLVLRTLKDPFPFDSRAVEFTDTPSWYTLPILSEVDEGEIFFWYCRGYIKNSQRFNDCPKLTRDQINSLNILDRVIKRDKNIEYINLQKGDVLLLNSHKTLHARNEFSAGDTRLLLRVWLSIKDGLELPMGYENIFGNTNKGCYRGGVWSRNLKLKMVKQEFESAREYIWSRLCQP